MPMARIRDEIGAALPTLSKLVFSQPVDKSGDAKVSVRPVLLKGGLYFQTERVRDNKASHRNLSDEELLRLADELDGRYRQVLIVSERESAQYCLRAKGGYKKTSSAASLPVPGGAKSHNREKQYILAEGENIPALVDLGVFTQDFRVVRSKYDKYKQINRFVELIDHELGSANLREISILDFGCGKSYLTFILYYYFTVKKGMRAKIIGYDLKADVVERCNEIAARYGYDGLRFECADVTRDKLADEHIDMVVTLHACDVATDYALSYAAARKVRYIFSVPCCQHEVNLSIKKGGELDIFMGQGIIKERMCALLTDSVRECILKDLGYDVDMIEFIDFEHSPKNIMIRAKFTGRTHTKGRETVKALQERYGFQHTLMTLTENI